MIDFETCWARAWIALGTATAAQAGHQLAAEPAQRFIDLILAALSSGRAHVAAKDGTKPQDSSAWGWRPFEGEPRSQGLRIGWLDGDDVYLEPEAAFATAQRFAQDTGEAITVSSKTLHKRLHEKRMLAAIDENRGTLTPRHTLEGKRRAVLHLKASLLGKETAQPLPEGLSLDQRDGVTDSTRANAESPEVASDDRVESSGEGQIGQKADVDDDIPF